MDTLLLLFLALQFSVFMVWGFLAFRWLIALRADAVESSGNWLPSMRETLKAFRGGLVEPRYRSYRIRMALLMILLIAFSILSIFIVK